MGSNTHCAIIVAPRAATGTCRFVKNNNHRRRTIRINVTLEAPESHPPLETVRRLKLKSSDSGTIYKNYHSFPIFRKIDNT